MSVTNGPKLTLPGTEPTKIAGDSPGAAPPPAGATVSADAASALQDDVYIISARMQNGYGARDSDIQKLTADVQAAGLSAQGASSLMSMFQNGLLPLTDKDSIHEAAQTIQSFIGALSSTGTASGPSSGKLQQDFQAAKQSIVDGNPNTQDKMQAFLDDVGKSTLPNKADILKKAGAFFAGLASGTAADTLSTMAGDIDVALGMTDHKPTVAPTAATDAADADLSDADKMQKYTMLASQLMVGMKNPDGRLGGDMIKLIQAAASGDADKLQKAYDNVTRDIQKRVDAKDPQALNLQKAFDEIWKVKGSAMPAPKDPKIPDAATKTDRWVEWANGQADSMKDQMAVLTGNAGPSAGPSK
jgi:hypothetical protein